MIPAGDRTGGREAEPGDLTIATFNLFNLFDLVAEPGKRDLRTMPSPFQFEVKLRKLSLAIRVELRCPELIVVQEIDNEAVLQELGDLVNDEAGTRYAAVSYETSDLRSIEVGFLYDTDRILLRESFQMSGPEVERAFGGSSPSPGREPIVGVFEARGRELVVIGNHFKSKGAYVPDPEERIAAERATERQRQDQALVVRRFVNRLFADDPAALVAVAGDFNDFHSIESEMLDRRPLSILTGTGPEIPLTDAVDRVPYQDRYTFVHYGAGYVLDHIFVSPALERTILGVEIPHFNAGYPIERALELETQVRASDHDPVVLRLRLADTRTPPE